MMMHACMMKDYVVVVVVMVVNNEFLNIYSQFILAYILV